MQYRFKVLQILAYCTSALLMIAMFIYTCIPCSCQLGVLNSMRLDGTTARNLALCENVFMMLICISLRIPLFLVGKPGSSKSFAKSIILSSMKGQKSHNELLTKLKEVCFKLHVIYNTHQCQ